MLILRIISFAYPLLDFLEYALSPGTKFKFCSPFRSISSSKHHIGNQSHPRPRPNSTEQVFLERADRRLNLSI